MTHILKLSSVLATGTAILLLSGCSATTSGITNVVKAQAKKAAVNAAKEKAVNVALSSVTGNKGGAVQSNATSVQVQTAKKAQSGMLRMRSTVPDMKKTYGSTRHLAGITEWVVPFYRINYLTNSNYVNQSNNSYTAATAKVLSTLEGVSTPIFDEITEIAYADFKAKMTTAGYTIKSHANMPGVQKQLGKSKYPSTGKNAYKSVPKGVTSTSGLNSTLPGRIQMKENVSVMDINLDANFVINNRNEKKFNIMQAKETVYTSQGANVLGGVIMRVPRHAVAFEIGQPPYSQIAFGTMIDSTKGGDKAGDAAVMMTGLLFGGKQKRRTTTKRKTVQADEARYKEAMVDALKQANTMIVNKIASYK